MAQTKAIPQKPTRPKFTIHYNIGRRDSPWIGTGWEFFDNEEAARERFEKLRATPGMTAQLRPFYEVPDAQHLGAVHRM